VPGRPHFLAARPAPRPFSTRSFPLAFYSLSDQRSYYGTVKFQGKRGSLPLNPSTHLLLPHFSSKALVHPLPCHGSLQCSIHRCRHKEDPTVERGITRQGHVMCAGRIDRPTERLRCRKGSHWRSRHAIGEDGRLVGPGLWPIVPRDGSPSTQGRGTHLARALSPHPTIGKDHRLVTPTHPTTGILTPRKVTI
jgi:hypothetical protein